MKQMELKNSQPEVATYLNCSTNCHIFDVKWIPTFPTKFIAVGTNNNSGSFHIYQLNEDRLEVEKIFKKKISLRCASFDAHVRSNTAITIGNFHGSLQIYDLERFDFPIYDVYAHNRIINCLDGIGGDNGAAEIVTGGDDGFIKVWDPRQRSPVVCISAVSEKDNGNGHRDCWSVSFADGFTQEDRVVCAAFDNGDIKVLDLKMMKERWGYNAESGVCKVCCDNKNGKTKQLIAGTVNGNIYVFDMKTGELSNKIKIANSTTAIWSVNHLPQNNNIFAACRGGSVEIWQHNNLCTSNTEESSKRLLAEIDLSTQPINCFDWNPDFHGLALCSSFDQRIHVLVTADV